MLRVFIPGQEEKFLNYAEALRGAGLLPVFSEEISPSDGCSALLLPGGGDVDPAVYGEENTGGIGIDRDRDFLETTLIRRFTASLRPILGICRGMQIINAALGGTLTQDVPHPETHRWDEETGDRIHEVTADKGSFLYPLYGGRFYVNSSHHQAVNRMAPGAKLSAAALDGTPEALELPEKNIYAVQFHPERMSFSHRRADTVDGREIFLFFKNLIESRNFS